MSDITEANKRAWNANASSYDSKPWQQKVVTQITEAIHAHTRWLGLTSNPPKDRIRLLDYACGPGTVTRALLPYITEAKGIDSSEGMVVAYNERMSTESSPSHMATPPSAIEGNSFAREPTPSLSEEGYSDFDIAAVGLGFHHFENPALSVQRSAERLRPGGVVFIIDSSPPSEDPNSTGDFVAHHRAHGHGHGHGHGHEHGAEHAESAPELDQNAKDILASIHQDGFTSSDMELLFSNAGLADFGYVTSEEPSHMEMLGHKAVRTPFFAKARKPMA